MDADLALLRIARANRNLVRRPDATRAGVSPSQWQRLIDRGEWVRVAPDVWRHALTPDTWQLRALAGLMYLGDDAALFGHTAVAWWDLDVPPPPQVEFVVPRGRRHLCNELVVHTTQHWCRSDLHRHNGARVTSPARSIIDFAGTGVKAKVVEDAIDSGVRSRILELDSLTTRMRELEPARLAGSRLLRPLLLDSGGESKLERKFLRLVRLNGIPRPTCQVVHRSHDQRRVMRVDFEYRPWNVVVEVTGRLGHVSDRERQKDARRRNALQRSRTVLEFTTADILDDAPYVISELRHHLR